MACAGKTLLMSRADSATKGAAEGEAVPAAKGAVEVVAAFCWTSSFMRVEPSPQDVKGTWAKCSVLGRPAVVDALCQQLRWTAGSAWQPRLRALCLLCYLHALGGEARAVSKEVARAAGGLIQRLTQVPECQERASRLVAIFFGASAIGAARRQGMTRSSSLGSVTSIASAASGDEAEVLHML
mmetsp:Transcript_63410/g.204384  ORF Transcript_63410/g.204384 Transcript_63410/m.204384 type:complete len:183 (+) Transcript_63410:53-601(+)